MRLLTKAGGILFCVALMGCASPQLGYDPVTGTAAVPAKLPRGLPGFRITCPRGTETCVRRAEAICRGRFSIGGWPQKSPRVQALIDTEIKLVNTDNPNLIYIVCN